MANMEILFTNGIVVKITDIDDATTATNLGQLAGTRVDIDLEGEEAKAAASEVIQALVKPPIVVPRRRPDPVAFAPEEAPRRTSTGRIAPRRRGSGKRTRTFTPNPPHPEGRWPDVFYITSEAKTVVDALRDHAKIYGYERGMSYEELGAALGVPPTKASHRANGLRRISPLIRLDDHRYTLTLIGRDESLRFEVCKTASTWNKKRGWDTFMAIPLPDSTKKNRPGKKKL